MTRRTRGKTRAGRLRLLDPWLVDQLPTDRPVRVLDLGIGARPDTTVELLAALRAGGRQPTVIGTDVEAERVAALAAVEDADLRAVQVDPDWTPEHPADAVRAANLLRQYRLERVRAMLERWGGWLAEGGLLVEGSTDRAGDRGAFRVLRRRGDQLLDDALILLHDLDGGGFGPRALTAYLPRGLGWHGHPGPALHGFFQAWEQAFQQTRAEGARTPAALFVGSAARLAARGLARPDPAGHAAGRLIVPTTVLSGDLRG